MSVTTKPHDPVPIHVPWTEKCVCVGRGEGGRGDEVFPFYPRMIACFTSLENSQYVLLIVVHYKYTYTHTHTHTHTHLSLIHI